jgi:hypothetical protein
MEAQKEDRFSNETREARYRSKCPKAIQQRLERALVQRLYLIDREDKVDRDGRVGALFSGQ